MVNEEAISRLNGLREFVDDQFVAMTAYLNVAGKALLAAEKELEDKHLLVALRFDPKSEEMRETFQACFQFSQSYPYIFRSSFLVHIHGFLEDTLFLFCKHIRTSCKLSLSVKELNGEPFVQIQKYIKKVAFLPFPDQTDDWCHLKSVRLLRNWIVHDGGFVQREHKNFGKIEELINKNTGIRIEGERIVLHDDDFLYQMIDLHQRFSGKVINDVISWMNRNI
jgi:hypothetical protein